MKQRLCVGIQDLSNEWQIVLDLAGLAYEEIDYRKLSAHNYSTVILNKKPKVDQLSVLYEYLKDGGSVLEVNNIHVFHPSSEKSRSYKSLIVNYKKAPAFQHIPFLDIFSRVYLHQESETLGGLVYFSSIEKGTSAFLGLDVPALLNKSGYRRKRFFNPSGIYPDEIVSDVSKNEVFMLFEEVLKELHFRRNLPYAKKWTSPDKKPVFAFRIDSDYGNQASIDALYSLAKKQKLSLTWFLHVEAHEEWLKHFNELKGQEIALHGYRHGTSNSTRKYKNDIQKGYQRLQDAGIDTNGYCAPYGIWNKSLSSSLKNFNFRYSSEFTLAYDLLPFQPAAKNLPLQLPIHPICTGSLRRHGLSIPEMKAYFEFVINNRLSRFEPVLLYHHPMQVGIECVDYIFQRAQSEKLINLSFNDFAQFWEWRRQWKPEIFVEGNHLLINSPAIEQQWVQVLQDSNSFDLFPAGPGNHSLSKTPEFEYSKQYLPEPEQVLNMRKTDFNLLKTSILDWKNRKKL